MARDVSQGPLRLLTNDAAWERPRGISQSTVYNPANSGHMPLIKLGRLTSLGEADLAAFVAAVPEGQSAALNRRPRAQ